MQIEVLLFGIIADLIGESNISMKINSGSTIGDFKKYLIANYPQLKTYTTYAIALNEAYALDRQIIQQQDTIAIIPPVSGG
jgi:molybdopterin converting factor subunit 1